MSLLDTLKQQLDGDVVANLAAKIGVDPAQAKSAIASALPTIVSALAKKSSTPEGAADLHAAVDQHDGGLLGKLQSAAPDLLKEGESVLGHVFGNKQAAAQTQVADAAKGSGLDASKIGDLMKGLAPMVMGALNQKKKDEGLDPAAMATSLQADHEEAKASSAGALAFLDADGDGDVMDDIADKGKSLLGGLGGLFGSKS